MVVREDGMICETCGGKGERVMALVGPRHALADLSAFILILTSGAKSRVCYRIVGND